MSSPLLGKQDVTRSANASDAAGEGLSLDLLDLGGPERISWFWFSIRQTTLRLLPAPTGSLPRPESAKTANGRRCLFTATGAVKQDTGR